MRWRLDSTSSAPSPCAEQRWRCALDSHSSRRKMTQSAAAFLADRPMTEVGKEQLDGLGTHNTEKLILGLAGPIGSY